MTWLDLLVGFVDVVEWLTTSEAVWGPALVGTGLAVGGWRMRPGNGRHRTPSAPWTTVRTVVGTVRTAASGLVRPRPDGFPSAPDATPVTSADGRPAVPADGRPPLGGREDGGAL